MGRRTPRTKVKLARFKMFFEEIAVAWFIYYEFRNRYYDVMLFFIFQNLFVWTNFNFLGLANGSPIVQVILCIPSLIMKCVCHISYQAII